MEKQPEFNLKAIRIKTACKPFIPAACFAILPIIPILSILTILAVSVSCRSIEEIPSLPLPEEPLPGPPIPEGIMGEGLVEAEHLAAFLLDANPTADRDFVLDLARFYVDEADAEGVNHDIAFSQMCLETGFLRFGGLVTPDMNNFCGLGSVSPGETGAYFPDPRTGVRAHIQHLKAYASGDPLNQALVDPRYRLVRYGSAPLIADLTGTWAMDEEYDLKIISILERLYSPRRPSRDLLSAFPKREIPL